MITREELLAFEFYKKKPFKGSDKGIRYMITKREEDILTAYIWPEPFSFEATPDEQKIQCDFPFSEEGLCCAMDWINNSRNQVLERDTPDGRSDGD